MNIWSSFRKKAQKNNKRQVCFFRQEYGYAMRLKYPKCTTNFVYVDFLFVPILNVYLSLVEYCLSTILQRVFLNYLGNAAFLGLDLIVNILMTSNAYTMLQKHSKCEDKAAWCTICLPLRFCVKSNFSESK